ncbi:MAG: tetratricopeptide repeat protein [Myxococcota bacterium]
MTAWHELRGETFVLYSDTNLEDLKQFALDISRFVAVVEKVAKPSPPNAPANFFLLSSESERLFVGESLYLGIAMPSLSGWDSYVRGSNHDPVLRQTLLHEFSHYLTLRNTSAQYPKWYKEGFAEFLSATRARDDMMEVGGVPHGRVDELSLRRAESIPIDLEETFGFAQSGQYPRDFYASSWAVVHYLNQTLGGRNRLSRMLSLQMRGVPWREAYNAAFDEPPAKLAAKIGRHVEAISKGAPAARYYLDLDQLEVETEWAVLKLEPAEVALVFGELALRRADSGSQTQHHTKLAAALLEKSQELDPGDLRSASAMVACLARQGDFEGSHMKLLEIDSSAVRAHETLNHLGRAYQLLAAGFADQGTEGVDVEAFNQTARALFERALEENARSAVSWAGLARAQMIENDLVNAKASFEASMGLGEWDSESMLDLGEVENRLGHTHIARELWQQVSTLSRGRHRKRAKALLKTLVSARSDAGSNNSSPSDPDH